MALPTPRPLTDTNSINNLIDRLDNFTVRLEKLGKQITGKRDEDKKEEKDDNFGTGKDFAKGFATGLLGPLNLIFSPFNAEKKKTENKKEEKQDTEETATIARMSERENILTSTVVELSKGNIFQEKMLEELTVIRKLTEGSLEFNKKSFKYVDPVAKTIVSRNIAKAREEDIVIGEDGKAKVLKKVSPIPNPMAPTGLDPSDTSKKEAEKAEDRELLADAIAKKLADILGNRSPVPSVDIDVDRRKGPKTVPVPTDIPDADRKPTGPGEPKQPKPTGGGGGTPSKTPGRIGKALFGLDAILSAWEVAQIEKEKEEGKIDKKTANEKQAGIVGGLAGAGAGAAIGAGFGAAFGGVGAIPGAIIGGVIGGLGGKFGSEKLANVVQNSSVYENNKVQTAGKDTKGASLMQESIMKENLIRTPGLQMPGLIPPINNTSIITNNNQELVPVRVVPRSTDAAIIRKLDNLHDYR